MQTSRRALIKAMGAGTAALAVAGSAAVPKTVIAAETAVAPPAPTPAPIDVGLASTASRDLTIVSLDMLEEEARKVLPPGRFAFTGPAGDGWTFRENRRAFNDYPIMPRRLQGVSDAAIDLKTTLLGHALPFPMIVCPMGSQGMIHAEAEIATATGAGAAGALFVASGASNRPMEEIAKATPGPKWFQIYMNRDMEINRWLMQRAKAAGFSAIVLTADALGPGQSDEFIRLGRPFPPDLGTGNHDPKLGGRGNFSDMKRDIGFDDIGFLHEASGLPVVVKGIVRPDDIGRALAAGAGGIWVSNHGGRQMDGVPASVSMLPAAVDAVAGRVPVILDSGIRRGIDVIKAVSLGATAVGVGRPVLYGLAIGGAPGVKSVFATLTREIRSAMLLSGVAKVTDLKRDNLVMKTLAG
jgi:lactate oxidase